jgi:hypothetical protein
VAILVPSASPEAKESITQDAEPTVEIEREGGPVALSFVSVSRGPLVTSISTL